MSDEYKQLIEQFESRELKEEVFNHKEHVIICLWHLENYSEFDAILRIKHGIMKYNLLWNAPQSEERGYHETITLFFIQLVQKFLKTTNSDLAFEEKVTLFMSAHPEFRQTLARHYTKEHVRSVKARKYWVEPDCKPL